jgi:hypothetical protein
VADTDGRDETPGQPAPAWLAIAVMGLVATLTVGGIVGWIRLTGPSRAEAAPPTGMETEVPDTLAGDVPFGAAPAAVPDEVTTPVLGARVITDLDDLPAPLEQVCDVSFDIADPVLVSAVVDTAGMAVIVEGRSTSGGEFGPPGVALTEGAAPQPGGAAPETNPAAPDADGPLLRATCDATAEEGGWFGGAMSIGPAGGMGGGSMGGSCCDADGFASASAEVVPPDGAAWALQDRGAYWLAQPVEDMAAIVIRWRYRESRLMPGRSGTRVLWIDHAGEVLDEAFLSL